MSFRNLAIPEMIQLSTPLLTPGTRQHEALMASPIASSVLPVLQQAHDGLVEVASGDNEAEIASELAAHVGHHDGLASQIGLRLDAEIEMAPSDEDRTALSHARDQIFPPGESLLKAGYAAKAGARVVRERRVTPASIAILATIPLRGGGTLGDTYAELQSTALAVSDADSRRRAVSAEHAGPRVREARKRWVAAIELIDMLLTAAGIDPTPILGGIREAQARAGTSGADDATPAPGPTPPVTT
jgi:hypothetical protein